MKFEDIKIANEHIKTIGIRGKQYAEVKERIKAFRMIEPNGNIKVELVQATEQECVMKATIYDAEGRELASDYAWEKRGASSINNLSYIENCATSAKGRALGSLAIGIDTAVASFEEVADNIINQEGEEPVSKSEKEGFIKSCEAIGIDYHEILNQVGVAPGDKMTKRQYGEAMRIVLNG